MSVPPPVPVDRGNAGGGNEKGGAGQFSAAALGRVFRVFTAPGAVFRELASSPTWFLALLIAAAGTFAVQLTVVPRIDFEATIRQAMAERSRGPGVSEERIGDAAALQKKIASAMVYATPLTVAVVFLAIAGLYLLGLKLVGSDCEFLPVFSATLHATIPASLVSSLLLVVVASRRGSFPAQDMEHMVKSSLGSWLDPGTAKPLLAVASSLDVLNVWQWVLLTVGLSTVGRVSRGRAAGVVAALWALWIGGRAAWAAIF